MAISWRLSGCHPHLAAAAGDSHDLLGEGGAQAVPPGQGHAPQVHNLYPAPILPLLQGGAGASGTDHPLATGPLIAQGGEHQQPAGQQEETKLQATHPCKKTANETGFVAMAAVSAVQGVHSLFPAFPIALSVCCSDLVVSLTMLKGCREKEAQCLLLQTAQG